MTILDLMKIAKEQKLSLTSVAFQYWDYLDPEEQRALAKELCTTFEENYESDLIHSLYEHQSILFVEHYIKQIDELLAKGDGVSIEIQSLTDLFEFIIDSTSERDFDKNTLEKLDAYDSMVINYREDWIEDEDERYYTMTCDFLETLEAVKKILEDLYC